MDFNSLINQSFQETELYELLLFELEENFEQNFSKFIHVYFDRSKDGKIIVSQLTHFHAFEEMTKTSRAIIEKKEWIEIRESCGHLQLILIRFDRTGYLSIVRKDSTRTEEWCHGWADETPDLPPMTPDELRQAFRELAGTLDDQHELEKLKFKKTV